VGCQRNISNQEKVEKIMNRMKTQWGRYIGAGVASIVLGWAAALVPSAAAAPAGRAAQAVWASDALYDVVVTDTNFRSPPPHSLDVLFNFGMSGLTGQRSVSESAPGDPDYNGGRWAVTPVEFTELGKMIHDPDGDGQVDFELTNAEQVLHHAELGHLIIHPPVRYFECPLLPRHQ